MRHNKEYRRTGQLKISREVFTFIAFQAAARMLGNGLRKLGIRCVRHHRREFDDLYKQEFEGWFPF